MFYKLILYYGWVWRCTICHKNIISCIKANKCWILKCEDKEDHLCFIRRDEYGERVKCYICTSQT